MYDHYDQIKGIAANYWSIYDQMDSALRTASLVEKFINYPKDLLLLSSQLDNYFPARNIIDQLRIANGLLDSTFQNSYRPEALARVDEALARFQMDKGLNSQLLSCLPESLVSQQKLLPHNLGVLNDSYSQLKAIQGSLASQLHEVAYPMDKLAPLLSAQSNWARMVRLPSSIEEAGFFTHKAATLFNQISTFYFELDSLQGKFGEEDQEEPAEQAIALANERLSAAFSERSPGITLQKIGELLAALTSGTLSLSLPGKKYIVAILINIISSFIFTHSVDIYKAISYRESPQVSKEVRREARKIRKEVPFLPGNLRVVIAGPLVVRRGPGLAASVIGRLYAGDLVVRIKTRNRSWSLVEFQGEDGEVVLRGWVFSRYIRSMSGCAYDPCRSQ
jgi:hypothetical protein